MNCGTAIVLAFALPFSAVANPPQAISVNFAQDKTFGGTHWNSRLDQPETAGVVPVENWNNLDVLSGTQEIPEELFLNDGSLSGATVIWSGAGSQSVVSIGERPNPLWLTPDEKIFKDYLQAGTAQNSAATITVSGLPKAFTGAGYKVYVYFDQQTSREERQAFNISGSAGIYTEVPAKTDFDGSFIHATGVDGSAASTGNYVLWDGLVSDSFTIETSAFEANSAGQWGAGISGFQIVAGQ